jgi:hypothetical protein
MPVPSNISPVEEKIPLGTRVAWTEQNGAKSIALRGTVVGYGGHAHILVFLDEQYHTRCFQPVVRCQGVSLMRGHDLVVRIIRDAVAPAESDVVGTV